jgi:hypothetical protein
MLDFATYTDEELLNAETNILQLMEDIRSAGKLGGPIVEDFYSQLLDEQTRRSLIELD